MALHHCHFTTVFSALSYTERYSRTSTSKTYSYYRYNFKFIVNITLRSDVL